MKKTLFILIFITQISISYGQCASDYVGNYSSHGCEDSTSRWNSIVKFINPTKILISNFANLTPQITKEEDTIYANLDCETGSLILETVSYPLLGNGNLIYSGSGSFKEGEIRINYHQITPLFSQDFCYLYKKLPTGISNENLKPAKIEYYPNPTTSIIYLSNVPLSAEAYLTNILGETCHFKINNNKIDLSLLNSGIYFLTLKSMGYNYFIGKIVKN